MLKDVEVQKSSVFSLGKGLQQLRDCVSKRLLSKIEATIARNEERFKLIDIYFMPCEDDRQYQSLLGEFIIYVLSQAADMTKNCNNFLSGNRNFPTEENVEEEIRKTEVRANIFISAMNSS